MLFWNKIEIYNGCSPEEFSQLKSTLAAANIRFDYKLTRRNNCANNLGIIKSGNGLGQKTEPITRYYLYVHQKDYYNAMHHISNSRELHKT